MTAIIHDFPVTGDGDAAPARYKSAVAHLTACLVQPVTLYHTDHGLVLGPSGNVLRSEWSTVCKRFGSLECVLSGGELVPAK